MSILWEDQFLIWSLPLMSHLTNSTLLCRQLSKMCFTRKWGQWKMLEKMRRYSSCHYDLLNSQAHVFLLFALSSLADNTTRPIPYNAALFPANELSRAQLWHKCSLCWFAFQLILGPLPNAPAFLKGAAVQLQLRIKGIQRADAGVYSCKAANRHGVTIKTITLSV